MKTIQARFTKANGYTSNRKYAFLVDGQVEVGDILHTTHYDDNLEVVTVFDDTYYYLDPEKNRLSKKKTEDTVELKVLKILDLGKNIIPTVNE